MQGRWLLGLLALSGCLGPPAPGPSDTPLDAALQYLAGLGQDGYAPSLAPYVAEASWAAGLNPAAWPRDRPVLDDVAVPSGGPLLAALRPLHALALADAPGRDQRVQRVLDAFDGRQFGDPGLLNDDAFALLVLDADGVPDAHPAVQAGAGTLLEAQAGGWPYAVGGEPGADTTGFALAALHASGLLGQADASAATDFLHATRDGAAFAETPGGRANCNSSVWALRGLLLLGVGTPPEAWDWLESLQQADGGLAYQPGQAANALCSAEAATLWGLRATGRLAASP